MIAPPIATALSCASSHGQRTTLMLKSAVWRAPHSRIHSGRYDSGPRAVEMSPRSMTCFH